MPDGEYKTQRITLELPSEETERGKRASSIRTSAKRPPPTAPPHPSPPSPTPPAHPPTAPPPRAAQPSPPLRHTPPPAPAPAPTPPQGESSLPLLTKISSAGATPQYLLPPPSKPSAGVCSSHPPLPPQRPSAGGGRGLHFPAGSAGGCPPPASPPLLPPHPIPPPDSGRWGEVRAAARPGQRREVPPCSRALPLPGRAGLFLSWMCSAICFPHSIETGTAEGLAASEKITAPLCSQVVLNGSDGKKNPRQQEQQTQREVSGTAGQGHRSWLGAQPGDAAPQGSTGVKVFPPILWVRGRQELLLVLGVLWWVSPSTLLSSASMGMTSGQQENPPVHPWEHGPSPGQHRPGAASANPHEQTPTSSLPSTEKPSPPVPKTCRSKPLPCPGAQAVIDPHLHFPVSVLQYRACPSHLPRWKASVETRVSRNKASVSAATVESGNKTLSMEQRIITRRSVLA
ncbi:uncharacterized protein LOC142360899 [Opisthocomus hoazin]|uniref:uncharacterized protein LOC142360899 n=1 Tax=Opisthocomus hoazin TaxID=30419 RepID=UPI003F533A51